MKFSKDVVKFKVNHIDVIGNTRTGSLVGLNDEGVEFVEKIFNGEPVDMTNASETIKNLYGALKDDGYFEEQDAEKIEIVSAYIHVTNRCNLNCLGCYSLDEGRNCSEDPSIEQVKRMMRELAKNGLKILIISGGEPMLRTDLDVILRYAKHELMIHQVVLITNGVLVNDEMILKIKDSVDIISVSVDGYDIEHPTFIRDKGIFAQLKNAVKIIKSHGVEVNVLPTIHRQNIRHMSKYVDFAKELGAQISFSLLTCSPHNEDFQNFIPQDEDLEFLGTEITKLGQDVHVIDSPLDYSFKIRKSCEIADKIVSIAADGSVYPCHMLHVKELCLGNVFEKSLSDILATQKAKSMKNLCVDEFSGCRDCRHKYLCGGGCRARSYYKEKNLTSRDMYCKMTENYFDRLSEVIANYNANG